MRNVRPIDVQAVRRSAEPLPPRICRLRARLNDFAAWDQILFTLHSLARIPSLKPIHVRRFSPLDATQLFKPVNRAITEQRSGVQFPAPPADPVDPDKVKGRSLFHFGAFFSKEARQQDYLTGRLDGVELILKMLQDKAGTGSTMTEEEEQEEGRAIKVLACDAYKAVVAAERMGAEPLPRDLLDFVRDNIAEAWAKI